MNMTLLGNKALADVIKMQYQVIQWTLHSVTGVLIKGTRHRDRYTWKRPPQERYHEAEDDHVIMDADMEVMNSNSRNAKDWEQRLDTQESEQDLGFLASRTLRVYISVLGYPVCASLLL